ncbi:hypothetical protein diail_1186 [Diaporthe ilicicola]|nr:hypothetical protein diail_1186 [Diaporthe ilicicola]
MFRDETVKVEKRVRASWGVEEGNASSSVSSSSDATPRQGPAKTKRSASIASTATSGSLFVSTPPSSFASTSPISLKSPHPRGESSSPSIATISPVAALSQGRGWKVSKLPPTVCTDPAEVGLSFYVNHYIIGYPDEVRKAEDLGGHQWFRSPSSQATMAALGLAGMGNLHNDKQLQRLSKVKYGEALIHTNEALRDPLKNLDTAIRTTIMLALFQLIPCITSCLDIPENFFDWASETKASALLPRDEKPGAELVPIIARFARLNAALHNKTHADGDEATAHMLRQLLEVDADMEEWESSQKGKWRYEVFNSPDLPREAVFRGSYHRYSDVWVSRVWNHFRWARLLTNQRILEAAGQNPSTAAAEGVPPGGPRQERIRATVRRLAVDVLTTVPTHYRHPRLTWKDLDMVQTHGGAGAGAVGIPHLMFHLRVAACAPGVPYEVWAWALNVLETVWAELGMLHAKSLADVLRKHRDQLGKAGAKGKLEEEDEDEDEDEDGDADGECA